MKHDASLVKVVYDEWIHCCRISATISRFGGLYVQVENINREVCWQGDNILAAKEWVSKNAKEAAA